MSDISSLSPEDFETRRLEALAEYQILDTESDTAFEEIVEAVSLICNTPIAVVNFVDRNRQWFKSEKGFGVRETPRDVSMCAHTILQSGISVVPDTTQDVRFANNPLVTGAPPSTFLRRCTAKKQGRLSHWYSVRSRL